MSTVDRPIGTRIEPAEIGFAPRDAPKCTVCGGTRLMKRGKLNVCSFVGCKDPTRDVDVEEGRRTPVTTLGPASPRTSEACQECGLVGQYKLQCSCRFLASPEVTPLCEGCGTGESKCRQLGMCKRCCFCDRDLVSEDAQPFKPRRCPEIGCEWWLTAPDAECPDHAEMRPASATDQGSLWVTHDRRYGTRDSHRSEADARREAAREPSMIDVVEYTRLRSASACQACEIGATAADMARATMAKQSDRIADLEAQISGLNKSPDRVADLLSRWIVDHHKYVPGAVDHGCARCVPDGPMTKGGFVCAYHRAVDIQAAMCSSEARPLVGHDDAQEAMMGRGESERALRDLRPAELVAPHAFAGRSCAEQAAS